MDGRDFTPAPYSGELSNAYVLENRFRQVIRLRCVESICQRAQHINNKTQSIVNSTLSGFLFDHLIFSTVVIV